MKKELIKNMVSLIVGEALLEFIENPTSPNIVNDLREKYSEKILSVIDSLQEEPKDRCRGCNNVKGCITCVDGSEYAHIEECNITGIKSKEATGKLKELVDNVSEEGLEEARKQLQESVSEDLEQAAKHYLYSNILYDDVYVGNPTEKDCIEMFKAGANWQLKKAINWLKSNINCDIWINDFIKNMEE